MSLQNIQATCYMCDEPATSVEHAPAKCFFPKGHRNKLITVPSCSVHNNETSMDDEYVRGIVVSCSGNNDTALGHWRGSVRKSYLHSPKLFLKTFSKQLGPTFFHDRKRVDEVMIKSLMRYILSTTIKHGNLIQHHTIIIFILKMGKAI